MNGEAIAEGERSRVVSVFLTCVACGEVEEICVPRERGLPPKVYWECLACQERGNLREGRPIT